MSKTDPAFPVNETPAGTNVPYQSGLTKRELFAAMMLQGLFATESEAWHAASVDDRVKSAIQHADALLKALRKA